MRARTLAIWGAVVLLLSIGLVYGGWVVSLTDAVWSIGDDCSLYATCTDSGLCATGPKIQGLCRAGTCEGSAGDKKCVGKYAAETGGYVMMGAGAVGVVAAVVLAVMAVRKARAIAGRRPWERVQVPERCAATDRLGDAFRML